MDSEVADYFAEVIRLAEVVFSDVEIKPDVTPKRAILRIRSKYLDYRVFVTELFSESIRQYRYYVLIEDNVIAGFDNSPDPRAIRMKYGHIGPHAGELIPHLHLSDKTELILTQEMTFMMFIDWFHANLATSEDT